MHRLLKFSAHATVVVEILADVLLQPCDQLVQHALGAANLAFESGDALFEIAGLLGVPRYLTLLKKIPKKSHGCS
jgi:hypothetical protein